MIKRHTKPTKENKGGIILKVLHQSNVKNLDEKKQHKKKRVKNNAKIKP